MLRARDFIFFATTLFCVAPHLAHAQAALAATPAPASGALPPLRDLLTLARERAPEVVMGRAGLEASRSSYASARMAPLGNPYLEVRAQRGTQGVTRDVNIDGSLWLPIELSGQRQSRGREAADYVQWHQALLEQSRAVAIARTVRAYGSFVVGARRLQVLKQLADDTQAEAQYYGQRLAMGDATERDAAMSAVDAARHRMLLSETQSELLRATAESA
ncbi:MAG: TolC family protein [Polyangiaceae bacterium]